MNAELVRPLWIAPLNFLGDCLRRIFSAGPPWRMHLSLARRLVEQQSLFAIPLTSGSQSPIFDALEYLMAARDIKSIPRLEQLYDSYASSHTSVLDDEGNWVEITYVYGSQDSIPLQVQFVTAKTLLTLYSENDAALFIGWALGKEKLKHLADQTIIEMIFQAKRKQLSIDRSVLAHAFGYLQQRQEAQQKRTYSS